MKQIAAFIALLLLTLHSHAQLTDDFTDGDFTNNPTWQGNTDRFQINAGELQLYDVDFDSPVSSMYLNAPTQGMTTWEFFVRLEFNPSGSNYTRVYLSASSPNFEEAINGYFVLIGGTDDVVELRRQTGASNVGLLSSDPEAVALNPTVRVRVTRDDSNNWELFMDDTGGTNFVSLGVISDDIHPFGSYFGVRCNYTTTRKDKFFFDDISIGPIYVDETPPELQEVEIISSTQIALRFNEGIDPASADIAANFGIDNGATIASTMIDPSDPTMVIITFTNPLVNLTDYTITSTVSDANGNASPGTSVIFTFIMAEVAEPYDMLVNEMMIDEHPSIGLPLEEYIEIYNRSDKVFELSDYELSSGGEPEPMPSYSLLPGEYVAICSDASGFNSENIIEMDNFIGLNNTGDNVTISDIGGQIIHSVDYTSSCFVGDGISLELINPKNLCDNSCANWMDSTAPEGGTPGRVNSVYSPVDVLLQVESAIAFSSTEVLLTFNGIINEDDATNISNYIVDNGLGNPSSITSFPPSSVLLTFPNDFASATTYTITATGISDCVGQNEIDVNNNTATFILTEDAAPFDLIITEIMADPSPVVALPEAEYIEIYNRSGKVINLGGYQLSSDTDQTLPAYIIMPGEYVMVCDADFLGEFAAITDNIITVSAFPSLSNTGDDVVLSDPAGTVINMVEYTDDWYQDATRDDGGWSLELISPNNPCELGQGNWRASLDDTGGTPGAENSVFMDILDETMPEIISATPKTMDSITVYFTEAIDAVLATDISLYNIDNGIIVDEVMLLEGSQNGIIIILDTNTPLEIQTVYELTVTGLTDCMGNAFGGNSNISFAIAERIGQGDVIINEVLFNPLTDGSDFIELYNNSEKIVNIADITIVNDATGSNPNHPILTDYLLFPKSYVVITDNPSNVIANYNVENELLLIKNSLPSLASDEGNVSLVTNTGLIDNFTYYEEYHLEFLDDTKGVSLERIDFDAASNDQNNWHSAAAAVGFATPTYRNSQYLDSNATGTEDYFSLTDDTFSPDNDGYKDFLQINYTIPNNGNLANIKVFDAKGRLVKDLVENQLLATEGFYQWDGVNEEGSKARIGIYVVWIEIFDINGDVSVEKKTCVLAGQL